MATADIVQFFGGAVAQLAKLDTHAEFGVLFVLRADWPDAAGDVLVLDANAPFAFRVVDAWAENQANNGVNANSVQVCKSGAGADPITDDMDMNSVADLTTVKATTLDDAMTIAQGGSLYLRVTKAGGTMGGTVFCLCVTQ